MSRFKTISGAVLFLCSIFCSGAFAQLETPPDFEVLEDLHFGPLHDTYYAPKNFKLNLGDDKKMQVELFIIRKSNVASTYVAFRYMDNDAPKVEFKYQITEEGLSIKEVSFFKVEGSTTEDGFYIKKIFDAKTGKIIRIVIRSKDETGEAYESIVQNEIGKNGISNVVVQTKEGGKTSRHIMGQNTTVSRLYHDENLAVKLDGTMYGYNYDGKNYKMSAKLNVDTKMDGMTATFVGDGKNVKLFMDYKDTSGDINYPVFKVVTNDEGADLEIVSKSLYEYNTNTQQYEASSLEVKEIEKLDPISNFVEKKKKANILFRSVNKDKVMALIQNYFSPDYKANDMGVLVDAFVKQVVEVNEGILGEKEKLVLFGANNSGGLFDYFKINLSIEYYYYMALLFGSLASYNELFQDVSIANTVISTFNAMDVVTVSDISAAATTQAEELEKILKVSINEKALIRFSNGLLEHGTSILKK